MDWADISGSSGFQYGLPLASALLAGFLPNRGSRAVQAFNTSLGIANAFSQQQKRDQQDALLRQKLGDVFSATQQVAPATTLPGATSNLGLANEEAAGLQALNNEGQPGEATAAGQDYASIRPQQTEIAPPVTKPLFNPQQQKLGEALAAANPNLAATFATTLLNKQPAQPHTFGSPETGYYSINSETGQPTQLVQGLGRREPTPPRPVFSTQGGEGVSSVYNPESKQWETTRTPLTAAPARQLSPQEIALKEAETRLAGLRGVAATAAAGNSRAHAGEANARAERLRKLTEDLSDPRAGQEKLTTVRAGLLREKKIIEEGLNADTPENVQRLDDINLLLDDSRHRLAEIVRRSGGGGQPEQLSGPGVMAEMPPASQHAGKTIRDTVTGQRYKSDGKRWLAQGTDDNDRR